MLVTKWVTNCVEKGITVGGDISFPPRISLEAYPKGRVIFIAENHSTIIALYCFICSFNEAYARINVNHYRTEVKVLVEE